MKDDLRGWGIIVKQVGGWKVKMGGEMVRMVTHNGVPLFTGAASTLTRAPKRKWGSGSGKGIHHACATKITHTIH